jgi:hypothetical protein
MFVGHTDLYWAVLGRYYKVAKKQHHTGYFTQAKIKQWFIFSLKWLFKTIYKTLNLVVIMKYKDKSVLTIFTVPFI